MEKVFESIGYYPLSETERERLTEYVNIKLAAHGCPVFGSENDYPLMRMGRSLIDNVRAKNLLLSDHLCSADQHIQQFLTEYLAEVIDNAELPLLPTNALSLERHGLARVLSLPADSDEFKSDIVSSYRVHQGVCHNPQKDRRTTKGVFHICEGGFSVPGDKKEVPKIAYYNLLRRATKPPRELMQLPFTSTQEAKAETFVSLLLRPKVCPQVAQYTEEKTIEVRFFAPGNLIANLDFVESIFGNAGDPFLSENDARLDVKHWSGHTGCVILAPHLIHAKKKDLGLPHIDDATERQKKDGMCWESEDEIYNDGSAFKVTCRDHRGVMVTIIADNYFGYCKKEVKSMLSYSSNLMGMCEEEHAGGALAFPQFNLGEDFELSKFEKTVDHSFEEVVEKYGSLMDVFPTGYGIDKTYPDIYYVPENVRVVLRNQTITWEKEGVQQSLRLQPDKTYVLPSGYKLTMVKPQEGLRWRLVGTHAEGTLCHKPCTVSGGGKSEISKPITDYMLRGPVITYDFRADFDHVQQICDHDYANRYKVRHIPDKSSRPFLSDERSLGSAVRLLTTNPDYTDDYNHWLAELPRHIRDLALVVKRFYKSEWGNDWRKYFGVDSVNGMQGHELKFRKEKLLTRYLRVGFSADQSWRTFDLRQDFYPSEKLQVEDDISASVVVPADQLDYLHPELNQKAFKFVENCEYRLFQRPDEAIVRGFDTTAESDFSQPGNFFSNYEPLTHDQAREVVEDTIRFDQFSEPIQSVIRQYVEEGTTDYLVSTSHPRLMDGVPTKNPRYLQNRPDLADQRGVYLANLGARLHRRIPLDHQVPFPVNSVLPGRRNNPADHAAGIRPLAVYNPVHYQELPEVFMEFIASLTGKSPSTTGAGSEGALTKGPFNAVPPIIDLNNALVSYLLTGNPCFTTSAGYIGPNYQVDHDISLLIPEVWSRMFINERDPKFLIENDYLEKMEDFTHNGKTVLASRLGYRINERFVHRFFGRMFSDATTLFDEQMLRPELQNMDDFVDGIDNITSTQARIAQLYLDDGTIELACPPLKALLTIMATGEYEGKNVHDESIRALFTIESLLESDWYRERLEAKAEVDRQQWQRHVAYLENFLATEALQDEARRLDVAGRLEYARQQLEIILSDPNYRKRLEMSLGTDPAVVVGELIPV